MIMLTGGEIGYKDIADILQNDIIEKEPANGIWWESGDMVGKVYDSHQGKMELYSGHEISAVYETVQVVDGLLMITQYDLPWREDLFQGWHFYDASQCMEFAKAGNGIAVPKQEKP